MNDDDDDDERYDTNTIHRYRINISIYIIDASLFQMTSVIFGS